MSHRTWIEIEERALAFNIQTLKALLPETTRFCAVVKANAYGHGRKEIVQIAARNGVDAFAVDSLDEALHVRELLPSALILVLGYVLHDQLEEAVQAQLDLTVYDHETIRLIETAAAKLARTADVHLKIETGTHRQGVMENDLPEILEMLDQCPHVRLIGVSTHFASLEDANDTRYAMQQLERFQNAVALVRAAEFDPMWIHCACSAGIILYPDTHGTLARAGISLYGTWPSAALQLAASRHGVKADLTPVLAWKTRIAQVKSVPVGAPIGYGMTEIAKRASRLAVLPVGYADGFDRGLSSVGEVLIAGNRCKVMGRVCMNMTIVDVSAVPNVAVEQEVVLIGRSGRHFLTADELAARAGTISYEILARLNSTLPRLVV